MESELAIPFVTETLEMAGIVDVSAFSRIPATVLEKARERGNIVHRCTEAIDRGEAYDAADYAGYIEAYQTFKRERSFVPLLIEHEIRGSIDGMRFVGMCDRVGYLNGVETVIDIKSSYKPASSWPIQTAAYAWGMWGEFHRESRKRAVVFLKKTGEYELLVHNQHSDNVIWKFALAITYWKMRHGEKLRSKLRDKPTAQLPERPPDLSRFYARSGEWGC